MLREAVLKHPAVGLIHYNLACHASVLGEYDEARKLLRKAFKIDLELREDHFTLTHLVTV